MLEGIEGQHHVERLLGFPAVEVGADEFDPVAFPVGLGIPTRELDESLQEVDTHDARGAELREADRDLAAAAAHVEVTQSRLDPQMPLEPLDEGGFLATSDDVPGLVAQGRTVAETLEIAQDVALGLIESSLDHGDELPPALRDVPAAKGDLRIPVTIP